MPKEVELERLREQIGFIVEIDKLKGILRQSLVLEDGRQENDAEHSWHICMMAVLLREYAAGEVDVLKVVEMLLIHDIVEIDAGDTFAYDAAAHADKAAREEKAAERLFGLLPAEQGTRLRRLWDEFEARQSAEARYAAALDRLQPMLLNFYGKGGGWKRHAIGKEQVVEYNRHMAEGAPALWEYARGLIEEAVEEGYLKE